MQKQFDGAEPARVAAAREAVEGCLADTEAKPPLGEDGRASLKAFEAALEKLCSLSARRPFDPFIRLCEAMAAGNAVNAYGTAGRWDDLERWGKRLTDLADAETFSADPAIRLREAMAAVNAVDVYGTAGRWDDLERWGKRLTDLADAEPFRADAAIRLRQAMAAVNAVLAFMARPDAGTIFERWGKRLTDLADAEPFRADAAIRLREAMAAFNAVTAYGTAGRWDDLERWGKRLTDLADAEPLPRRPSHPAP